jgi:hypothetical protein
VSENILEVNLTQLELFLCGQPEHHLDEVLPLQLFHNGQTFLLLAVFDISSKIFQRFFRNFALFLSTVRNVLAGE